MKRKLRLTKILAGCLLAILILQKGVFAQDFEIENMPIKTTGYAIDHGWALGTVGYVADTVEIEQTGYYRFSVRAKIATNGSDTPAQIEIRISNKVCGPIFVDKQIFAEYKTICLLQSGRYQFSIHLVDSVKRTRLVLERVSIHKINFPFSQLAEKGKAADNDSTFSNISVISGFVSVNDTNKIGGHSAIFADVNGDDLPDIYLTRLFQGTMADLFFINQGNNTFAEQGAIRGISDLDGGSHGSCFADFDNDGDYDLLNGSTFDLEGLPANNNLYKNDGNGYFEEVTPLAMQESRWPTRAALAFDMDNDGDLDIFTVSNYRGSEDPPDEMNELYRNDGNFVFTKIDTGQLVLAPAGQGATAVDYDNDGDMDVFAGNRTGPVNILQNDGTGNFTLIDPQQIGIMHQGRESITFADIDRDSCLDALLLGDESGTIAYLYHNNGDGTFSFLREFSPISGYMGNFGDIDNDGDLDLVFAGDDVCYLNDGAGNFEEGPSVPIDDINDPRALSFADIDLDGDLDFAVGCKRSGSLLIRNNISPGNNWINVKLESKSGQAGAFGARVYVYPAGRMGEDLILMQEAQSSQGYLGQNNPVLHFGVGHRNEVDVFVKFLDGTETQVPFVRTNQTVLIKPLIVPDEQVTTPSKPIVNGNFWIGAPVFASSDSARSNLNHEVEYRFDWGDSAQSEWGDSRAVHIYERIGIFKIKARARCKEHITVVSDWSEMTEITIVALACETSVQPDIGGFVEKFPQKNEYGYGDTLSLLAIPDSDFAFVSWNGDTISTANPIAIILKHNFSITALFSPVVETITIPCLPMGPDTVILGKEQQFVSSQAVDNLSHVVEYQFSWGDGSLSSWGDSLGMHAYNLPDTFLIRTRARCMQHHDIVSDWSPAKQIYVKPLHVFAEAMPDSGGVVQMVPQKNFYSFSDSITLTALPKDGWKFSCWTGDVDTTAPWIELTVSGDIHVFGNFTKINEIVDAPKVIQGPRRLFRNQEGNFVAIGAADNLKHPLQFQFDWGDGNLSYWGDSLQSRAFYENGSYIIRSRSRCSLHPSIVSDWSDTIHVVVRGCKIVVEAIPTKAGNIEIIPDKADYNFQEIVNISAIPGQNYKFVHWNSELDTALSFNIKIQADTTLKAYFKLLSGIERQEGEKPRNFALFQNYPNPFNGQTTIAFQSPEDVHIKITIFNISGQVVDVLADNKFAPGKYFVQWNGCNSGMKSLPSGVYWIVLETSRAKFYRKMVMLR